MRYLRDNKFQHLVQAGGSTFWEHLKLAAKHSLLISRMLFSTLSFQLFKILVISVQITSKLVTYGRVGHRCCHPDILRP